MSGELGFDRLNDLQDVQEAVLQNHTDDSKDLAKKFANQLGEKGLFDLLGQRVGLEYKREAKFYDFDDESKVYRGRDILRGRLIGYQVTGDQYEFRHFCLILENVEMIKVSPDVSVQTHAVWCAAVPVNGAYSFRTIED